MSPLPHNWWRRLDGRGEWALLLSSVLSFSLPFPPLQRVPLCHTTDSGRVPGVVHADTCCRCVRRRTETGTCGHGPMSTTCLDLTARETWTGDRDPRKKKVNKQHTRLPGACRALIQPETDPSPPRPPSFRPCFARLLACRAHENSGLAPCGRGMKARTGPYESMFADGRLRRCSTRKHPQAEGARGAGILWAITAFAVHGSIRGFKGGKDVLRWCWPTIVAICRSGGLCPNIVEVQQMADLRGPDDGGHPSEVREKQSKHLHSKLGLRCLAVIEGASECGCSLTTE